MTYADLLLSLIEKAYAEGDLDQLRRFAIAGLADFTQAVEQWDALERASA